MGRTSLTGEGKLNGIAPCATEGIYDEVTTTSLRQVLRYLLWSGTEPALWRTALSLQGTRCNDDVIPLSRQTPSS